MNLAIIIPEIGQLALILALCLATLMVLFPVAGQLSRAEGVRSWWYALTPAFALGQFLLVLGSGLILMYCFVSNDFSVAYVAQNSNTHLPLFYRLTALWGAHAGSVLLWTGVLSLWTLAVALFSNSLPQALRAKLLAILGVISFGFLMYILAHSDPFVRLLPNFPANGQDLNPLLQDPGLAVHPPVLYMGYVGLAVPFAFAVAVLWHGKLESSWVRWLRPWVLGPWCFLTLGITLGSWWSYRVLGWGGWWFWDPVENASFLPWLASTALLHVLVVTEKRKAVKDWSLLFALVPFSLSIMGTFLVRSGVLISVHAFAVDPSRGVFLLQLMGVLVGGALMLYVWRGRLFRTQQNFHLLARETMMLTNGVLLMVAMATVLLGTLYPLIVAVMGWGRLSVGPPYFNAVFVPIMVPVLILMGLGPHASWQRSGFGAAGKRLWLLAVAAIVIAGALVFAFTGRLPWAPLLGVSLGMWVIVATVHKLLQNRSGSNKRAGAGRAERMQRWAMSLAHIGVAVCVMGISLNTASSLERDVRMQPGDNVTLGKYNFHWQSLHKEVGPNYHGVRAKFVVRRGGSAAFILHPQHREFPTAAMALSVPAIHVTWLRDVYVVLGQQVRGSSWSVRIYIKPAVRWIWLGGLLIFLAGLLALWTRRLVWLRDSESRRNT